MPEDKPRLIDRFAPVLKRFGYAPIRDTSQTLPELAENLQWEGKPAKTLDYLDSYERAIWTYAAVYRIATSAAKVPFKIYKKRITKNGKRAEQIDKLVNHVLEIPNPYTTRFDLWEATLAFAELTGNSYWELVSEADNPPEEIYVLRPDHIKIKPSQKKLVESYVFEANGRDIRLLPEDILHFKYFSSKSELYGTSANAAAEKSIVLDLYSLDFNARFFKAGARIMGVLETDRHLSDKAMKRLNAKWIGKYGGYQKAFKTPVLEEGLKYKGITSTHTDMEFIEQRKITREEILAAYGVHPAIVGLFEYCIAKGEKILMANGEEIEIEKLEPGQKVLNFNEKKNRFEKHKILNIFPRGERQVYELKTGNRSVKVTDNHPFLTLLPGINPAYPRKIGSKRLKDLKKGDLVAILTEVPDWVGQGNNHLPDGTQVTKDLMEQLGLYMGDGNCTFQRIATQEDKKIGLHGNSVSIAIPETDPNREYYVKQAERVWNYGMTSKKFNELMYVSEQKTRFEIYSAKAVEQIYDWGLFGTSRTKHVPKWIFRLEKSLKKAFLKGYFDADGSYLKFKRADGSIKRRIQVAASNEILVKQIRKLCIQVGYSVTNINEQHRMTNYGWNDLWRFLICNFDGKEYVKYNSSGSRGKIGCKVGGKRNPLLSLPSGINWASIKSISQVDKMETFDFEIEGVHNAFAGNGNISLFNSNYANAEAQKKLFWEDTMVPKLKKLQENVTSFLLPRYGSHLIGEFDISTIEALQESEEAKQKISCGLTDSGIMTRNEAREKFYQLDKISGGDKITIRGKYVVVEDTEPENDENPEDENPENGDENPENDGNDENFDFSKAELDDFIVSLRKRLKKRIKESK